VEIVIIDSLETFILVTIIIYKKGAKVYMKFKDKSRDDERNGVYFPSC
jgi:hypothetical protein